MKRLKLRIYKSDLAEAKGMPGTVGRSQLLDADTNEPIACVKDFIVRFPMLDVPWVDAHILLSEIEVL